LFLSPSAEEGISGWSLHEMATQTYPAYPNQQVLVQVSLILSDAFYVVQASRHWLVKSQWNWRHAPQFSLDCPQQQEPILMPVEMPMVTPV